MKTLFFTIYFLLVLLIVGTAQPIVEIPLERGGIISAEGKPHGYAWGYGLELGYSFKSNHSVRIGYKFMPLEIYSEVWNTQIRYTEEVFYASMGAQITTGTKSDYFYPQVIIGKTKLSNKLFVGFKGELQGINLYRKDKERYNLNPFVSFNMMWGFKNEASAHILLSTGLAFKF